MKVESTIAALHHTARERWAKRLAVGAIVLATLIWIFSAHPVL